MITQFLTCNRCGKQVSTLFHPVPTETPDKGLIVRAWIECPECLEKQVDWINNHGSSKASST